MWECRKRKNQPGNLNVDLKVWLEADRKGAVKLGPRGTGAPPLPCHPDAAATSLLPCPRAR